MAWEPKKEVVEVMALWLFNKEHPDVLDWEADEKAADEKLAATKAAKSAASAGPTPPTPQGAARTEYEERARAMLMIARKNSGSGG